MDSYDERLSQACDTSTKEILLAIKAIAKKEETSLEDALVLLAGSAVLMTTIQRGEEFVKGLCESCVIDGTQARKELGITQ